MDAYSHHGKQINRIQSGSWQGRYAGAGLRQNLDPEWSTQAWKDVTDSEPNDELSQMSQIPRKESSRSRETKSISKAKEARNWRKSLSQMDNTDQARRSYSRYDGDINADDVSGEHTCKILCCSITRLMFPLQVQRQKTLKY